MGPRSQCGSARWARCTPTSSTLLSASSGDELAGCGVCPRDRCGSAASGRGLGAGLLPGLRAGLRADLAAGVCAGGPFFGGAPCFSSEFFVPGKNAVSGICPTPSSLAPRLAGLRFEGLRCWYAATKWRTGGRCASRRHAAVQRRCSPAVCRSPSAALSSPGASTAAQSSVL